MQSTSVISENLEADDCAESPLSSLRDARRQLHCVLLLLLTLLSCSNPPANQAAAAGEGIKLTLVASGLTAPLYLISPQGDVRLFIVEQPGRIRIVKDGKLLAKPFLNITDRVGYGGERGLLSVAFHPDYAKNKFFFVNYTDKNGDTHVERYTATSDPDIADPQSAKLILRVDQPYPNHNGGHIVFGPDRMLYIAMGDGGAGGDPMANGQNRGTLLAHLLRIDIDHGDPYAIPPDNPYRNEKQFRGEIWAWGLRNPWRIAFDETAHLLYIADVGQNHWEEIDVAPSNKAGVNYGWNIMEGNHCYIRPMCNPRAFAQPVLEYAHADGCSVTGGYVYRGRRIPAIAGHYFYGDYCLGWIRSFKYDGEHISDRRKWDLGVQSNILSFGQDSAKELYVCFADGKVYRFDPA